MLKLRVRFCLFDKRCNFLFRFVSLIICHVLITYYNCSTSQAAIILRNLVQLHPISQSNTICRCLTSILCCLWSVLLRRLLTNWIMLIWIHIIISSWCQTSSSSNRFRILNFELIASSWWFVKCPLTLFVWQMKKFSDVMLRTCNKVCLLVQIWIIKVYAAEIWSCRWTQDFTLIQKSLLFVLFLWIVTLPSRTHLS